MRLAIAIGGNALLRRGEPMTAANQRRNIAAAAAQIARVAPGNELVIAHGNGPQVGLLALQGAAYAGVEPYPLDVLGAETEGMIGYLIEQELGNRLPPDTAIATLLTQVEVDPDDPAFRRPSKPIGGARRIRKKSYAKVFRAFATVGTSRPPACGSAARRNRRSG